MPEAQHAGEAQLLERLEAGAAVLTGNARLSRSLTQAYDRRMAAQEQGAWATPRVLPLTAWLREAWQEASLRSDAAPPRLLSAEQETQVWAGIVRTTRGDLMRPDAAAKRARGAWAAVREWGISLGDRRFADGEAAEQFRHWANRFQARCKDEHLAIEADLPGLLIAAMESGAWSPPSELVFTGFFELTPAQQGLVEGLTEAGAHVEWLELHGPGGEARRFEARDPADELATAARWARGLLAENPEGQVGIVVPDLGARRAEVAQVLATTLEPQAQAPGRLRRAHAFNLSLGAPLTEAPVVRLALMLLSFTAYPVATETLGRALRSPLWAAPREAAERRASLGRRALFDRQLRRRGDQAIALNHAARMALARDGEGGEPLAHTCPELGGRLRALADAIGELPTQAGPAEWARHFTTWLTLAGWAQGRPLDSAEYQAVEAWHELLTRFAGLGDFSAPMSRDTALGMLRRMAAETPWQPKAPPAPVQVLGLLEAIGQPFDHLWVMGLHDAAWPRAPQPDPFIPIAIQRQHRMPGCDADREARLAAHLTERLLSAAEQVVFSHPERENDEPLAPSPLIEALPAVQADDLPLTTDPGWADGLREAAVTERLGPESAIPTAGARARGGSSIVRNQANCPFRAFAEHRLGAKALDEPRPGLDPMRRGSLLHHVLELTWQAIGSHARLVTLSTEDRADIVRTAIGQSLSKLRRKRADTLTARYRQLETDRLLRTVLGWLEIEQTRAPFEVVAAEKEVFLDAEDVTMRVVIDRIDQLEDGRVVVLDYKTGVVSPGKWFGERPEDPQLPLYSVALQEAGQAALEHGTQANPTAHAGDATAPAADRETDPAATPPGAHAALLDIAAVAFAQIRPGDTRFKGVVASDELLPGLPGGSAPLKAATETWPDVLEDWRGEIYRLARRYRAGEATVDPKRGTQTCQATWCDLAPLCRIGERAAAVEAGESADVAGEAGDHG